MVTTKTDRDRAFVKREADARTHAEGTATCQCHRGRLEPVSIPVHSLPPSLPGDRPSISSKCSTLAEESRSRTKSAPSLCDPTRL